MKKILMMQQRNNMLGLFLLSATALIWGGSFVAQKLGMDHIGPFSFTFFSDLLAGTFLLSLAVFRSIAKGERFSWSRTDIIGGCAFVFAAVVMTQLCQLFPSRGQGKTGDAASV